jgi:hypothetical protein
LSRRRRPVVVWADLPPIVEWDPAMRVFVASALERFGWIIREYRGQIENEVEPPVDVVLALLDRVLREVLLPEGVVFVGPKDPPK